MALKIEADLSPIAAGNFVALASCGFYDGTVFHRTATLQDGTPFVIQGGDGRRWTARLHDPGRAGHDAVQARHRRDGAHSRSRTSVDSQFFIVLDDKDAAVLSSANTYQIIGNVTSGMETADAIFAASGGVELPAEPGPDHDRAPSPTPDPRTERSQAHDQRHHRHRASATSRSTCSTRAPRRRPPTSSSSPTTGFYDDVIFHRVIPGFVAQAGDGQYGKKSSLERGRVGTGGPGYKFEDEPVQGDYVRGALAMANAGPNTNGSQFFICHQDLTGKLPEELHAVRPGDPRDGRRRRHRRGAAGRPGPPERPGGDDLGDDPSGRRLRNLHPRACQNPWKSAPDGVGYRCCSVSAAPATRSWVGRVRVVGAADVIDALDARQKRSFRRTPSPGQHRGRFLREPASAYVRRWHRPHARQAAALDRAVRPQARPRR